MTNYAPKPTLTSEGLPGPDDLDDKGMCWLATIKTDPGWVLDDPEKCTGWDQWLPYNSIPLPRQSKEIFNGISDYLESFNMGQQDFGIEAWIDANGSLNSRMIDVSGDSKVGERWTHFRFTKGQSVYRIPLWKRLLMPWLLIRRHRKPTMQFPIAK